MSETVEIRSSIFYNQRLYQILGGSETRRKILSLCAILFITIVKSVTFLLDCISNRLKILIDEENKQPSSEMQVDNSHDLMDLVTHHFGALHEENYIKKIIHNNQWNRMNSELNLIKEQLHKQQRSFISLKEEMKDLNDTVKNFKTFLILSKHDKSFPVLCSDHKSDIPSPPPLPPSGFISSNTESCATKVGQSSSQKRLFGENCPPRPLITVESLKQVKLKKVPSLIPLKEEKDDGEETDLFPSHFENFRKRANDSCKNRPKTADSSKIKPKNNMTISPPRPLTSDS